MQLSTPGSTVKPKLEERKGREPKAAWAGEAAAQKIPVRVGDFGPLTYQNDNVLQARLGPERVAKIRLLNSEATPLLNTQDLSELYAYEIVNFVDGKRSVGEIRDAVSAEYGPLAVDLVDDYLERMQGSRTDSVEMKSAALERRRNIPALGPPPSAVRPSEARLGSGSSPTAVLSLRGDSRGRLSPRGWCRLAQNV